MEKNETQEQQTETLRYLVEERRGGRHVVTGTAPEQDETFPHMLRIGDALFQKQDVTAVLPIPPGVRGAEILSRSLAHDLRYASVDLRGIWNSIQKKRSGGEPLSLDGLERRLREVHERLELYLAINAIDGGPSKAAKPDLPF